MTTPHGPGEVPRPETLRERILSLRVLDFEVAGRAALAVTLPLVVLALAGRLDLAAYASFGAMAALFGRNEPYRMRTGTVAIAATALLLSVAFGAALAVAGAPIPVLALGLVGVITAGLLLSATAGLFPATPLFFVFAFLVCAQVPTPADELWPRILVTLVTAAFAWSLTMSGWLLRWLSGGRTADLFKDLKREPRRRPAAYSDRSVWLAIGQHVLGVLAAGGLALLLGIGHPYWAVMSVIAVLPPPGAAHSTSRAFHRIIGTVLGVAVTGLVLFPGPPVAVLIMVIAIGQFGAEILIGRHYGAALLFITPLALTVAHFASPLPLQTLLVDRVVETALGGGVALVIVLVVRAVGRAALRQSPAG